MAGVWIVREAGGFGAAGMERAGNGAATGRAMETWETTAAAARLASGVAAEGADGAVAGEPACEEVFTRMRFEAGAVETDGTVPAGAVAMGAAVRAGVATAAVGASALFVEVAFGDGVFTIAAAGIGRGVDDFTWSIARFDAGADEGSPSDSGSASLRAAAGAALDMAACGSPAACAIASGEIALFGAAEISC
jgi:hypothetical protein